MVRVNEFIANLIKENPPLVAVYEEHLRANDECLPHVFMGDVTRYVVAAADRPELVIPILASIDAGLEHGGQNIDELVGVSFVENLFGEDQALRHVRPLFGEHLRQLADLMFREAGLK